LSARRRIGAQVMRAINVFSGATILGFAAWPLTRLF